MILNKIGLFLIKYNVASNTMLNPESALRIVPPWVEKRVRMWGNLEPGFPCLVVAKNAAGPVLLPPINGHQMLSSLFLQTSIAWFLGNFSLFFFFISSFACTVCACFLRNL